MMREDKRAPVLRLTESLSEVMFRFTNVVMYFAPGGVGAAMAFTVGHMGPGVLVHLGKLLLTFYGALAAFAVLCCCLRRCSSACPSGAFWGRSPSPQPSPSPRPPARPRCPRAMEAMEAFGVPRRIVSFVIPAGYSFNLDGSTLYLAIASVFVAQAAGIHLSIGMQLLMMGTLILTSKGVAGVPRAVLVVLLATASTFHLPTEPIFVILGIDALLDMARTMINVVGNCLASAVIAQWEGSSQPRGPPLPSLRGWPSSDEALGSPPVPGETAMPAPLATRMPCSSFVNNWYTRVYDWRAFCYPPRLGRCASARAFLRFRGATARRRPTRQTGTK